MRAIFFTIAFATCLTATAADYVEVITNNVNIRTEASTSSAVVGKTRSGNVFEVYKRVGDWVGVFLMSGEPRYIYGSLVRDTDTVPELPEPEIRKQACVEMARAQRQARAEAQRLYPIHLDRLVDHERLITDRLELPIFQRYGIAPAHNAKLLTECVTRKWG